MAKGPVLLTLVPQLMFRFHRVIDPRHTSGTMSRSAAANEAETADQYGRLECCFSDHRKPPFCFHHHLPDLRQSAWLGGQNCLIDEPGLTTSHLRVSETQFDSIDDFPDISDYSSLLETHSSSTSSSLLNTTVIQDLKLPAEELVLPSNPKLDLSNYYHDIAATRELRLSDQWLPLCRLQDEKDEGLQFPLKSGRLRLLLLRELDRETVSKSVQAAEALDRFDLFESSAIDETLSSRIEKVRSSSHVHGPSTYE